ncbi:hypothetical protein E2C01_024670 [Portunus trituberculatus]|uniref:Uncharacterized protein n=1 Tax=Portunus trituberculatus TaxID=210409 RepID=A0A5B7EED2_PORTR|nr:hypothetical protein [Portunus trituberculatus]
MERKKETFPDPALLHRRELGVTQQRRCARWWPDVGSRRRGLALPPSGQTIPAFHRGTFTSGTRQVGRQVLLVRGATPSQYIEGRVRVPRRPGSRSRAPYYTGTDDALTPTLASLSFCQTTSPPPPPPPPLALLLLWPPITSSSRKQGVSVSDPSVLARNTAKEINKP